MRVLSSLLATVVALSTLGSEVEAQARASQRTLVFAIDGLAHDAFLVARERGLFKRFGAHGGLISTYPTMSNPSWTEVFGTRRVFGNAQGNIRTAEAAYFDLDAMRVMDDPRNVVNRQANPYHYTRVLDYYFDPLAEPLMYLPNRRLLDRELAELEREVTSRFTGDHFVAYVSGVDAVAHTHAGALYEYLRRLDASIERIYQHFAARGEPLAMWILSDHGNAGSFAEGGAEVPLRMTTLRDAATAAGLRLVERGQLTDRDQVAIPVLALGSLAGVYFGDLARRRDFASAALRNPAVDLVTWLEMDGARGDPRHLVIRGRPGREARLYWRTRNHRLEFAYVVVTGNPLGIPERLVSRGAALRYVSDRAMFDATRAGAYPDGPLRLVESAEKSVENAPDLMVNLRDGFAFDGTLTRYVEMVRTHGSLSARSTLGVVASTGGRIPSRVRGREVLALVGIGETAIFHRVRDLMRDDPAETLRRVQAGAERGVATGIDDDSPDMRFLRRSRPIAASMDIFTAADLRELSALLPRSDSTSETAWADKWREVRSILRRTDPAEAVTRNLDTLLALGDAKLAEQEPESALTRIEERLLGIPGLAPLAELRGALAGDSSREKSGARARAAHALRRAVMKLYTAPFFLNEALMAPETETVPETRDLAFAAQWQRELRPQLLRDAVTPPDAAVGATLFAAVFAERKLWASVAPATVPLLYNPAPDDVTVVYVPGIYNELFDHEIFSRGLRAIRERLGVRTLYADVDGRCSSGRNALEIVELLRRDTRRRLERGYPRPRYLLLGYSKGGVDATEALLVDTLLTRSQIAGLLTIASPHHGTRLVTTAELPALVTERAVARVLPAGCREESAAASLRPATRARFWEEHGARVAGLTRFFSIAFVSDMQRAHPWMKLTKTLAAFRAPNDGVVPLESARFPAWVHAVDLGVVEGDHLAGILASDFPQGAFLEAALITLFEMRALEPATLDRWHRMIASRRAATLVAARGPAAPAAASAAEVALRERTVLPPRSIAWRADRLTTSRGGGKLFAADVTPMSPERFPRGVRVVCDHQSMRDLRAEHEFYYDAESGVVDDRAVNGFAPVVVETDSGPDVACRLRTRAASVKMTTVSYRFRPVDFPEVAVRLKVVQGVTGADPTKGARGRNDTAFKIWFVLRDLRDADRSPVRLFGYYWADPNTRGELAPAGALSEAASSRRRIVVVTLPEAWQIALGGGAAQEDRWIEVKRDLAADIRRAYPGERLEDLQVVAITIQTDSDDTQSESEVYLKHLTITPRDRAAAAGGR